MPPDHRLEQAKRILLYRPGTCPPEVEQWILNALRTMSFWDMIGEARKFRIRH